MEFSNIESGDLEEIIALTKEHLTDGSYVEKCIRSHANAGNYYGVKAMENGELAGYLTFKEGFDFTYPHPELDDIVKEKAGGKKVFNGDAIYVNPKYRKQGLGGNLTRLARNRMIALGGYYFLGELWIHPDGKIPALTPTAIYGETEVSMTVPMFYKDNARYGLTCPICGGNCVCGALICLIRLSSKEGESDEEK